MSIQKIWARSRKIDGRSSEDEIGCLKYNTKKTISLRDTWTPMFITGLFIIARTWNQPRCPSADKWIGSCGTYTPWNITRPLKRIYLNQF